MAQYGLPNTVKVDLPDGWKAEFDDFGTGPLVSVRLSMASRLDLGKRVFIDPPFSGPNGPSQYVMDALIKKVAESRMTDDQRRLVELEGQVAELKRELARMQRTPNQGVSFGMSTSSVSPTVVSTPVIEQCRGGCSRGGDGPACGKLGCRG